MNKLSLFVILAFLIISCESKSKKGEAEDSSMLDSSSKTRQGVYSDFRGVNLSFEKLDTILQMVLKRFHEPEKFTLAIHPDYGFYWIKPGAGVYPVVKEIKSEEDLRQCKEYLLIAQQAMPINGYFDNPEGVDLCHPHDAGIFIFKAKKNQLLFKAYQGHLLATDKPMPDALAKQLHSLDAAFEKYILFNLPSKNSETTTFDLYLARINGKLYLAAIDTRGCEL